ncbi:E3 ubiquitin-protein ligase ATL42-like [Salvia hispanica]|uniref:E3 ubiquitin-protein ligase ATL42-like n=1 Tax=Salvia hispanica TaxID=49212 RepID=UPI002009081C|nr:E3 ubiquitin-protein ligase ATL42-like [Salvia hispanica]
MQQTRNNIREQSQSRSTSITTAAAAANTIPPPSLSAFGLDKSPIEALPFFRFSSLLSSRFSLECAVCLAKFDDAGILCLLPKCIHAFHIGCIDQWLETNCTCPLCCLHGTTDDLSASLQFLHNPPPPPDSNLELELEAEREDADAGEHAADAQIEPQDLGAEESVEKRDLLRHNAPQLK